MRENSIEVTEDETDEKKPSKSACYLVVFAVVCFSVAITIGLCLHFLLPKTKIEVPRDKNSTWSDCYPQGEVDRGKCEARGCEFRLAKNSRAPNCTFPEGYGYVMQGSPEVTNLGHKIVLQRKENQPTLYGNDLSTLELDVEYHDESRIRLRFRDPESRRYQVPKAAVDIPEPVNAHPNNTRLYDVQFVDVQQFGVKVIRRSTGTVVFDTSVPGLTFSDQYIQLTTRLPSDYVYGLGEHNHRQFRHDMNWKKWAIFTRDVAPVDEWNLYGAQPMYMNVENDGNANAVLLLNSNAMDVVLQPAPSPGLSFHVIGGILDFYIFLGPTPENTVQQYVKATGMPLMPPYWSLGFQLCKWDYDNLTYVRHIVDRNRAIGIPQDVQYGDIDYMESKLDFTVDAVKYDGLSEFVDELHTRGQKYIVIQDHAIGSNASAHERVIGTGGKYYPYIHGNEQKVWVKTHDNETYLRGEVWPGEVLYPDFTLPRTKDWWRDECQFFHNSTGWRIEYDALWIDMNEPSNFIPGQIGGKCRDNSLNYPPYVPQILGAGDEGKMYDKTICMDAIHHWGNHYDTHSLYGHAMSIQSFQTMYELWPTKRPFVLTRSNFVGTQKYAMHWLGDNQSQWRQIPWSIVGMLEYSLFGFSYTGSDICGFWYATDEEMCTRWMQLGAFYPFARNHNAQGWPDQDPAAFSEAMQHSSREVLKTRYKLLPFLYTLLHHAHTRGSTVARPLLHEWPTDETAMVVDKQFLWGPSFLITPVMEQGHDYVTAYIPNGRWYDYYTGSEVADTGSVRNLSAPLDYINLHVRGGYIIPWQEPDNTTVYSRQNPMGLIVALGQVDQTAEGDLFWDDGESYETQKDNTYLHAKFTATQTRLQINIEKDGYPTAGSLQFNTINIWGLTREVTRVTIDGTEMDRSMFRWDTANLALTINDAHMQINQTHTVTYDTSG